MAEIVNLRRARKAKARVAGDAAAQANRMKHGESGGERKRGKAEREKLRRDTDGKKLDSGQ